MGFLKETIAKFKGKSEQEKALEQQIQIEKRVQDKMKSANERELERYQHEHREKQIEHRLQFERKRKSAALWKASLMKNNARAYIDNTLNHSKVNFLSGGQRW